MFGMRAGARKELRWGIVAAAALAVLAASVEPADARFRRKHRGGGGYSPPYAALVVDANNGQVLHASNADALRHPASLTKIMTLYLLFEQLEAGRLKLDSELDVSAHAASQSPTKLGLRPGQTLDVENAIKALVTKSANDAAVVVAEAIGGDEESFARMMTRKARAIGMSRTVYSNASGLPNPDQVTTARDQVLLGRAIQERFPRYYPYFATLSFRYRGIPMRNHNHLLGRVEGVDGIKTGYTRASGFNLVSSVRRGGRHIVAVVLGGPSRHWRDARMNALIEQTIAQASPRRQAPKVAESFELASNKASNTRDREERDASEGSENAPSNRNASVLRRPARPAEVSDQIHPIPVKTIVVKPGQIQSANVIGFAPRAQKQREEVDTDEADAKETASTKAPVGRRLQVANAGAAPIVDQVSSLQTSRRGEWVIQIGAFDGEEQAKRQLNSVQSMAKRVLGSADPFTEKVVKGEKAFYRARFAGLDKDGAEAACKYLKRNDVACLAMKN